MLLQVKDMKESIGTQERALSELTNTCTAFKRHQVTVIEKFERLDKQVWDTMLVTVCCIELLLWLRFSEYACWLFLSQSFICCKRSESNLIATGPRCMIHRAL
jgi:hypothetical protein